MLMRGLKAGVSVLAIVVATGSAAVAQTTTSNSSNLGSSGGGIAANAFTLNSANTVFTNTGTVFTSGTAVTTATGAAATTSIVNSGTLSNVTSPNNVVTSTAGGVVHFATSGALNNSGSIIASGSAVTTAAGSTVTITNSGTIRGTSTSAGTDAAVYFGAGGTLTNSGTIQATGAAVSVNGTGNNTITNTGTIQANNNGGNPNAIVVNSTGTFTLTQTAGTITNNGSGAAINIAGNTASGSAITISGGVVSNTGTGSAITTAGGASIAIAISGGTISSANSGTAGAIVLGGAGSRLTVSGGTVTSTDGIAIQNTAGTVTVSGGAVTAAGTNRAGIDMSAGTVNVSGGTVTGTGSAGAINFTTGTNVLNWSGGTLTNGITSAGGTNTVNITGSVTATGTQFGGSYTTSISSAGTLNLANGATFSPAGAGITNAGTIALSGAAATVGTNGQTLTNTGTISVGSASILTVASSTFTGTNGTVAISLATTGTAGTNFGRLALTNTTAGATNLGTLRIVLPANNPGAAVGTYASVVTGNAAATAPTTVTSSVSGYSVTATANGNNIDIVVGAFNVAAVSSSGGAISTEQRSTVTSLIGSGAVQGATADAIRSAVVVNGVVSAPALETVAPSNARGAETSAATATSVVNVVSAPVQTRLAAIRLGDASNMASASVGAAGMSTSGDAARGRYFWVQALGGQNNQDARSGSLGYKSDFYGSAFGADFRVGGDAVLGASFSYGRSKTEQKGLVTTGNQTQTNAYTGMVYGSYSFGAPFVEGNAGYARMNFTTDRNVSGAGLSRGEYDGNVFFGRAAVGYLLPIAANLSLTPSLGADATRVTTESYTESTGARGAFGSTSGNVFRVGPSARANHTYRFGEGMRLLSEVRAGYTYRLNNSAVDQSVSPFAGAATYTAPGVKPARGETTVGGSLSLANAGDLSVGAGYDLTLRDKFTGHAFTGRLRLPF